MYLKGCGFIFANEEGKIPLGELKVIRQNFALGARTPRFNQICAGAVWDMFKNGEFNSETLDRDCGLIVASRLGPVAMVSKFQDEILEFPEDQVMAGNFANSVHNAPAGALTVMLDIRGPAFSVMGFEDMLPRAFELAELNLATQAAKELLLVAGEEHTIIGESVRKVYDDLEKESAAVFYLTSDPVGVEIDLSDTKNINSMLKYRKLLYGI